MFIKQSFVPASVKFNFDLCAYKNRLINAIKDFQFGGETMNFILDKYLDLDNTTILGPSLLTNIIDTIVSAADAKVNGIKDRIIKEIESITCKKRYLEVYEIDGYGYQRMLDDGGTFDALESAIRSINDNVQSVAAGYFAGRSEIAIDVGIHVEQTLTNTADIKDSLNKVFDYFNDAKAMFMFGATEAANVAALVDAASATVEFDLSIR